MVSAADRVLSKLIANHAEDSLMLIKWFADNHMKANPDKFQAIAVGKCTKDENSTLILIIMSYVVRIMLNFWVLPLILN